MTPAPVIPNKAERERVLNEVKELDESQKDSSASPQNDKKILRMTEKKRPE